MACSEALGSDDVADIPQPSGLSNLGGQLSTIIGDFASMANKYLQDINKRGKITEAAALEYNAKITLLVEVKMKDAATVLIDHTKVKTGDSVESAGNKVAEAQSAMKYLAKLFSWIVEKLQSLLSAIKWCWQKAKDLFQYLKSFFV